MDTNTAAVAIAAFTMITSVTTAALAYYTNRRTRRIEQKQQLLGQGIARLGTLRDDQGTSQHRRPDASNEPRA